MAPRHEWYDTDFYKVLGVSDTATDKEITRAYRKLAKENHPDAKPGDAAAETRFKEISAAYDVLGDAEKRKEYDEVRRLGPIGNVFGGGGGRRVQPRQTSASTTSATCSATCSTAVAIAAVAAVRARRPVRNAATTSPPNCT